MEKYNIKLILNKQDVREWIRFMCQERAQKRAVEKKYGEFLGYLNG